MGRRRDPESSLELLLDTMCNTFGGVMFIAIALVVVISVLRPAVETLTRDRNAEVKHLQSELEKLERELAASGEEFQAKQQLAALLAADPRREFLEELLLLERDRNRLSGELALLTAQTDLQALRQDEATRSGRTAAAERRKLAEKLEQQRAELEAQQERRRLLETEMPNASAGTLNFKRLEESPKRPFFLIVNENCVWKVGPHITADQFKPDDDVTATQNGDKVSCRIKPDRGVPLLSGEELSPELRAILRAVPPDRVPDFRVEPKSARAFSAAREIFKREQLQHGCNTVSPENAETLDYMFADHVTYEY